jgi:hypothetical protein
MRNKQKLKYLASNVMAVKLIILVFLAENVQELEAFVQMNMLR